MLRRDETTEESRGGGTAPRRSTAGAAAIFVAALLFLAAPAASQEAGEISRIQQTQAEVPDDWAERAGICRRTVRGCEGRRAAATRLSPDESIRVDGRLDEDIWRRATWITDFIQIEPIEGARPTVRTEVAFVYDEGTLYVGGRNYDPEPERIRANLARRDDNGESDRLKISIDSYLNRQTSYTFTITAAGGRVDYFTPSDAQFDRDHSYEPVWTADAEVTDEGWFSEMAIPFSQLRFNQADELVFGVNINRYMPGRFEDLFWAPVPKDETGWTSWFGDLVGLRGIETRRPIELVPYVASDLDVASRELVDPDDPFSERSEFAGRMGADLKMGIGSGLTLDATFNPDFGQVEADPAEVNLSAFPTFFSERRPFFVENADLLGANGLFFSRRIGERPHGTTPGTHADVPEATTILGAAKLTGRTAKGLSIGALGALTGEESADYFEADAGTFGRTRVEPTAGWLVLRGLQEFGTANNEIGLAFTGVRRDVADDDPLAARLNREAYAGGADLQLQFDGGLTEIAADFQASHVSGSPDALARVQRLSTRYFQRPDGDHVEFDPTRTSMAGYRASVELDRRDGDHWSFGAFGAATSPGFEINDAGALGRADRVRAGADLGYTENSVGTFRSWSVSFATDSEWNYDADRLSTTFAADWDVRLRNFWSVGGDLAVRPRGVSDTQTRGGPLMGTAAVAGGGISLGTPFQARLQGNLRLGYEDDDLGGHAFEAGAGLSYRPGGAWQFELGPSYFHRVNTRQYVGTLDGGDASTFGRRYVFGTVDQHTLSAEVRVDYAFSPGLSIEGYFEPFVSTGEYSEFGELVEAGGHELRLYGSDGTALEESGGGAPRTITVRDGDDEFSFPREDFRSLSFRSNLVMRWEWMPGSTLFAVWQLDRGGFSHLTDPDPAAPGDLLDTPGEPGRNFFALKATYWLPI